MLTDDALEARYTKLESLLPSIYEAWKTIPHAGYAASYQALSDKCIALLTAFRLFRGCSVLDIGCNSGLYTLILGLWASKAYSVDVDPSLLKRASVAHVTLNANGISLPNVHFRHSRLRDALDVDFD